MDYLKKNSLNLSLFKVEEGKNKMSELLLNKKKSQNNDNSSKNLIEKVKENNLLKTYGEKMNYTLSKSLWEKCDVFDSGLSLKKQENENKSKIEDEDEFNTSNIKLEDEEGFDEGSYSEEKIELEDEIDLENKEELGSEEDSDKEEELKIEEDFNIEDDLDLEDESVNEDDKNKSEEVDNKIRTEVILNSINGGINDTKYLEKKDEGYKNIELNKNSTFNVNNTNNKSDFMNKTRTEEELEEDLELEDSLDFEEDDNFNLTISTHNPENFNNENGSIKFIKTNHNFDNKKEKINEKNSNSNLSKKINKNQKSSVSPQRNQNELKINQKEENIDYYLKNINSIEEKPVFIVEREMDSFQNDQSICKNSHELQAIIKKKNSKEFKNINLDSVNIENSKKTEALNDSYKEDSLFLSSNSIKSKSNEDNSKKATKLKSNNIKINNTVQILEVERNNKLKKKERNEQTLFKKIKKKSSDKKTQIHTLNEKKDEKLEKIKKVENKIQSILPEDYSNIRIDFLNCFKKEEKNKIVRGKNADKDLKNILKSPIRLKKQVDIKKINPTNKFPIKEIKFISKIEKREIDKKPILPLKKYQSNVYFDKLMIKKKLKSMKETKTQVKKDYSDIKLEKNHVYNFTPRLSQRNSNVGNLTPNLSKMKSFVPNLEKKILNCEDSNTKKKNSYLDVYIQKAKKKKVKK